MYVRGILLFTRNEIREPVVHNKRFSREPTEIDHDLSRRGVNIWNDMDVKFFFSKAIYQSIGNFA